MEERWKRWDRPRGTASKDPVPVEVGGGVEAPEHPPPTRRERLVGRVLVSGGLAIFGLGIPAAAAVVIGKLIGGPALAVIVAVLVVTAGVLLARIPIPGELSRQVVLDARERGDTLTRTQAHDRARGTALVIGCCLAAAGGIGLALAFAAL